MDKMVINQLPMQRSILCGESLARAIRSFDLPVERLRHLTPGGTSALQLLAGNPLPAVSALDDEVNLVAPIETRPRRILLPVDGSAHALEVARWLGQLVNAVDAAISLLYVQGPGCPVLIVRRSDQRLVEAGRLATSSV